MIFAEASDPSTWAAAAVQGGICLIFLIFLVGLARCVIPWLERKDEAFVVAMEKKETMFVEALKSVTDAHERANEKHTKAIDHVAQEVKGIGAEVGRLRSDILERNSQ